MVEEDPGLVEDQQRRPAVEALLEPVEQIGEHRRDHTRLAEQRLGLEALHVGESEPAFRGIQQPAVGSIERIGLDRSAQRVGLEYKGQPGHRPERKSDVEGKGVSVRVDLGGRSNIKQKNRTDSCIDIKLDRLTYI